MVGRQRDGTVLDPIGVCEISNELGMLGLKSNGRVGLQGNWNERLKETAREEPQEDCFECRIEYN